MREGSVVFLPHDVLSIIDTSSSAYSSQFEFVLGCTPDHNMSLVKQLLLSKLVPLLSCFVVLKGVWYTSSER